MSDNLNPSDASPYGLLGRFPDSASLVAAIRTLRGEGHAGLEAFSPYPDEALGRALGFRSRWLTVVTLVAALAAAAGGYWMVWYSLNVDYPVVVSGKPLHGWPAFVLIAFVLAILAAVTVSFVALLAANRLPRPYHPAFNVAMFSRATNDAFFLLVTVHSLPHGDIQSLRSRLGELGAEEVHEVPP